MESERDAGDESDLGVGRFDPRVRQTGVQGGFDRCPVFHDAVLERDEGRDALAASPVDPAVERFFVGLAFEHEHGAQAFFE